VIDKIDAALGGPDAWEDGTTMAAALATSLHEATGVRVPVAAFDLARLPAHLRITFAVDDERGVTLAHGKELAPLRDQLATRVRAAIARAAPIDERRGITSWDVGELAMVVETVRDGVTVRGYPALMDDGDSVSIRVLTDEDTQRAVQHGGVRRLLLLAVPVGRRAIEADLTNSRSLAIARSGFALDELEADCLLAAADRIVTNAGDLPFTESGFAALVATARNELAVRAARALRLAADVLAVSVSARERLDRLVAPAVQSSVDDARGHLARLVRPGFVATAGTARLTDLVRYVQAIDHRLQKLPEDPARDRRKLAEVTGLEQRYRQLLGRSVSREVVDLGWQLEELRVSLFAQQLGAAKGISAARLGRELAALGV
ncbi:MAG TPA: DUF3418 domain-containing protein, partial [Ilumatobacteraceae bacterium]|nr:DUF3418 domain-containing protein [Ilumatobacteraceae bacterium]